MNRIPLAAARTADAPRPLVVDLDDTLVRTDTLVESVLDLALSKPLAFLRVLPTVLRGRPLFKRRLAELVVLDYATLPYNQDILAFIRDRRAAGAQVYLVTAADQSIADGVALHLGLFDGAIGSDGAHNLKGLAKAAALVDRLGSDFDYIGDSTADLPVWSVCSGAYVAGNSGAVRRKLGRRDGSVGHFPALRMSARDWVKALRLHQWSKNLLLFITVLLGQHFTEAEVVLRTVAGFIAFGMVASATYLLNDIKDLSADRGHYGKRYRAMASGRLSLQSGLALAFILLCAGMAGGFALMPGFGLVLSAYLALTLTYSLWLKRQPLVDVLAIGALFTVRIQASVVLTHDKASVWLSSFAFVLFTSLATAKRHAELVRARDDKREISGRGYSAEDLPLTLAVGIAAASLSIIEMLLYLQLDARHVGLYERVGSLLLIPVVLTSWLMRVWMKAHRGELHDDPVVFAIKDKVSILHGLAIAILWLTAVI